MSHTTKISSVKIKSGAAIKKAATDLQSQGIKCSIAENVSPRMYYARQQSKCPYVLKLENCAYDVGFVVNEDGSYSPVFDPYMGYVSSVLGVPYNPPKQIADGVKTHLEIASERHAHEIGKFLQAYSKNVAIDAAIDAGHSIESVEVDSEGRIQIMVTV